MYTQSIVLRNASIVFVHACVSACPYVHDVCVYTRACVRVCDLWAESCKHYTLCPVQSIITSGTQNT